MNTERESQRYLAKPRVHVFDPVLEPVGREGSHVAHENGMHELANRFALLLGIVMHARGHAVINSMRGSVDDGEGRYPRVPRSARASRAIFDALVEKPSSLIRCVRRGAEHCTRGRVRSQMLSHWRTAARTFTFEVR